MVTVIKVWTGRGFSPDVDDSRGAELVGRTFGSVEEARQAALARVPWPACLSYWREGAQWAYVHLGHGRFGTIRRS